MKVKISGGNIFKTCLSIGWAFLFLVVSICIVWLLIYVHLKWLAFLGPNGRSALILEIALLLVSLISYLLHRHSKGAALKEKWDLIHKPPRHIYLSCLTFEERLSNNELYLLVYGNYVRIKLVRRNSQGRQVFILDNDEGTELLVTVYKDNIFTF